jgi:uncharacterized protein YcaQ
MTRTRTRGVQISWQDALHWRMERQRLVHRAPATELVTIASELGGLHAQLMSSAELTVWARTEGFDRDALDHALWSERTLVKTWAMRGTLHLLPAAELGVWLGGLGTYTHYGQMWSEMEVLADAVRRALAGKILSRDELATKVVRITGTPEHGEWLRESWGSYLKASAFRGLLCFAPSDGGRVRFAAPGEWVPGGVTPVPADEALRQITRRFLAAYGPVPPADLARWWKGGMAPSRGEQMIRALGEEAVEIDVGRERVWLLTRDVESLEHAASPDAARLLPAFDPWVVAASRTSRAVVADAHRSRVYRPQAWLSPVVLVNGRMLGVWKHERKGARLRVTIEPFGRLPAWARVQLESEVERLAGFLGGRLELTWQRAARS